MPKLIGLISAIVLLLCSGVVSEPTSSELKPYDSWADCESFCERASTECNSPNVGEGVMCQMECDVAAQYEGQEITEPAAIAVRDQLLCVRYARTCDAVNTCLEPK